MARVERLSTDHATDGFTSGNDGLGGARATFAAVAVDLRGRDEATNYDVFEVFTPTTQATLNFVERPAVNDQLVDALRTPGKQVIVYGETGSGKSTLLQHKLAQLYEGHIVTQCHASMTFEQVLLDAFDQLAPFFLDSHGRSVSAGIKSSLGAEFLKIKASIESSLSATDQDSAKRALPPQLTTQRLGEFLGERNLCWVIEDFHKMTPAEKVPLAQSLKVFCDLARTHRQVKIIAIGATNTAREVVEYDPEMSNRVAEILVPLMTDAETRAIIDGGERLLNIEFGPTKELIVAYSVGVASICHQIALNCCLEKNITIKQDRRLGVEASDLQSALRKYIQDSSDTLKGRFERALLRKQVKKFDNGRLILKALADGPVEGMLHGEIMAAIRKDHPTYPAGNLTQYLRTLQSDQRGALIRAESSGRFCFIDPFHHLYAHLTLSDEAVSHRLSGKGLLQELQKELEETVVLLLRPDSYSYRRARASSGQMTLWSHQIASSWQPWVERAAPDDESPPDT